MNALHGVPDPLLLAGASHAGPEPESADITPRDREGQGERAKIRRYGRQAHLRPDFLHGDRTGDPRLDPDTTVWARPTPDSVIGRMAMQDQHYFP
jgi:hypothetical protein